MDRFIEQFPVRHDGDLSLCLEYGVAYQTDRQNIIQYNGDYWNKCAGYEDSEIALKISKGRIEFVDRHYSGEVLDIGVGCGEFIKKRNGTYGYDINPKAVEWLLECGLYRDCFSDFDAFTMWDVLEHVETPEQYFINIRPASFLFLSLPIFGDLAKIRESKHYRPGEHLYYWTRDGLIEWMLLHKFELCGHSDFETQAGRESIESFAFRKR
jgi:hypothetical protein